MKIPDSKLFYGTAALLTAAQLVSAQTPPSLGLQMVAIEFSSLAQLTLPTGLTGLIELDLGANVLTRLALPADATNLAGLSLFFNQLTNLTLPPGLAHLAALLSPQKFYRERSAPWQRAWFASSVDSDHLYGAFVPVNSGNQNRLQASNQYERTFQIQAIPVFQP